MEYRVLGAVKIELLEELVAEAIAHGWALQGGVAAIPTAAPYHNFGFYQAVTRPTTCAELERLKVSTDRVGKGKPRSPADCCYNPAA